MLLIFSRHHKKTQDENLTIVTLTQNNRLLRNALTGLREQSVLGGWEESLKNQIVTEDEKMLLKGFELLNASTKRKSSKNDFDSIRSGIIDSIINRLGERFESDDTLMQTIEPFLNFDKNADIRKIHELFATDLDLSSLSLQFNEMVDQNIVVKCAGNVQKINKTLAKNINYKEIVTTISRIQVCTPHSSDVERCISANNMIKTPLRNRLY